MTTGAYRRRGGARRGVILILVLGVLGLMAVIGVTFATFTGQSRIATRSFAQSKVQPQSEELMDFALAQLVTDTNDVRSAIRGHSLARDMYGNDGARNGLVEYRSDGARMAPNSDPYFYVTQATAVGAGPLYDLQTNIPAGDPLFYGFNFNRWTIKVAYVGAPIDAVTRVINQSLEVVADSGFVPGSSDFRVLRVVVKPDDANAQIVNPTYRDNPNLAPYTLTTVTPAKLILQNLGTGLGASFRFTLDGRWLHAFNGPGRTDEAVYGNFRYNADSPGSRGMDEDYDAVDLENWFLAMQSADGQVVIPSFHRPAVVRYDQASADVDNKNDWDNLVDTSKSALDQALALRKKLSRIMRPRQVDGHDPQAFPDLVPNVADGKITYDVDNDGDGVRDSVWVDLGYPARRNAQGNLYKPMFAFMVIGLNGRMPLNTVGNMAARGGASGDEPQSAHAAHLGNSVSEIDPTYGLQNYAFGGHSQVDNADVDVRLTQLRNILAGTRPQPDPTAPDLTGLVNGDVNWVAMGATRYYMPNGQVDTVFPPGHPNAGATIPGSDIDEAGNQPATGNVRRRTEAVPGRWGEPDAVRGGDYQYLAAAYTNEVRPGYSLSIRDYSSSSRPFDAADDDRNSFDVYPLPNTVSGGRIGEARDRDLYDASGSLVFPVERIRRFVTPTDINGSGRVTRFNSRGSSDSGGDAWGRVEYRGYFRPPGLPGQIDPTSGLITYWTASRAYPNLNVIQTNVTAGSAHNNNMLHGYESFLIPNTRGTPQRSGGLLAYKHIVNDPTPGVPTRLPTYDSNINTRVQYSYNTEDPPVPTGEVTFMSTSDGLNEADEMNLYNPNPTLDDPFGFPDLEWLYRSHDVDGGSLSSRLSQLAPISFTNSVDGLRRRRLYSIDTWESNTFAWANDNPMGLFEVNAAKNLDGNNRFGSQANAGMGSTTYTPGLAQRGRKINLNMPLPVSNDPKESIRQKWISDAYQLMKTILPPRAIDTPEECAQLGQYLVNLIDFRDPDCTMTIWDNPDVYFIPVGRNGQTPVNTHPQLTFYPPTGIAGIRSLRHYGMEYNPVAINEVLAYSYGRKNGSAGNGTPTGRFFIELANTLSQPGDGATEDANASVINLSGYNPSVAATTPYEGACWDLVFSQDSIGSRPDPFTGQLQQGSKVYSVTPLSVDSLSSKVGAGIGVGIDKGALLRALPRSTAAGPPLTVLGFTHPDSTNEAQHEHGTGGAGVTWATSEAFGSGTPTGTLYLLKPTYDPFNGAAKPATINEGVLPRALDGSVANTTSFAAEQIPRAAGAGAYYWVHLRRPANPMAPVSDNNPMVVVDSMRFPYVDVAVAAETTATPMPADEPARVDKVPATLPMTHLYSYQRHQPYRGGQAVPWDPTQANVAIDPRYGYTEQIAAPVLQKGSMAVYFGTSSTMRTESGNSTTGQVSNPIYNTLGVANDGAAGEFWDWFPFHDRDFTSPYELTLVPACGPGLFTKQFAEFAPSAPNEPGFKAAAAGALITNYGSITTKPTPLTAGPTGPIADARISQPFLYRGTASPVEPHTYPYLVDKFFYTGANPTSGTDTLYNYTASPRAEVGTVGGYAADGWFKMLEFFEVPSQSTGSIGLVEDGTNFDWARQDVRPGLLNLNLIIDEEVFFGLLGLQDMTGGTAFAQKLLNSAVVPTPASLGLTPFMGGPWTGPLATNYPPIPMVVTATRADGSPAYAHPMPNIGYVAGGGDLMKAAFAQFLWARHGGSGFVFGFGGGATGQNQTITPATITPPLTGIPAERPFRSPSFPDVDFTPMRPATMAPSPFTDPPAGAGVADPGVRNQVLFGGYERSAWQGSNATTATVLPPPIPTRRLFQPADAHVGASASNAGLLGSDYINTIRPTDTANPTIGGLPNFGEGATNLFLPTAKLGDSGTTSMAQHPYFRGEQMQRITNLTTVRTHQYAVWITIGFFEVKREGDIAMIGDPTYPTAAFDLLGPEIGAATGENTRYRSFFVVDRLKLTGFDPDAVGAFRPAVVYRRTIR